MTKPLNHELGLILDAARESGTPEYWQLSAGDARAQHEQRATLLSLDPAPMHAVNDMTAETPIGTVPFRIYRAHETQDPQPVLVYFHGGGHVIGSINSYDSVCRALAEKSDCIVISVDYRLAPEHKFPAAVDDCQAAVQWIHDNASTLGIDRDRIAVGGDSAGANLATVVAIMARDEIKPTIRFQLLIYPIVAPRPATQSHAAFKEGYLLTRKSIDWFNESYIRDDADRQDWRFAPMLTPSLKGLPPALVIVAGYDPLRDEGIAYAERLAANDVEVKLSNYEDMVHAFINMGGAIPAAREALDECASALRLALT